MTTEEIPMTNSESKYFWTNVLINVDRFKKEKQESTAHDLDVVPQQSTNPDVDANIYEFLREVFQVGKHELMTAAKKRGMSPPLTRSYRLMKAMSQVSSIQESLYRQIGVCDVYDELRNEALKKLRSGCEELKRKFDESETAVREHVKQEEHHKWLVDYLATDTDECVKHMKRFRKAGKTLVEICEIMQTLAEENRVYVEFLEKAAEDSGRFNSAKEITDRYEELISLRAELSRRINEAFEKLKDIKETVAATTSTANVQQQILLGQLDLAARSLDKIKSETLKFETVLSNITIDSIERRTELVKVVESVGAMIEKLIAQKVLNKSYRKKTLAQQMEAVVKDFQMKKAIIQEYNKSMASTSQKHERRINVFDEYKKNYHSISWVRGRLYSMKMKKYEATLHKEELKYSRYARRMKSRATNMLRGSVETITSGMVDQVYDALTAIRTLGHASERSSSNDDSTSCSSEEIANYSPDYKSQSTTISYFERSEGSIRPPSKSELTLKPIIHYPSQPMAKAKNK